MSNESIAVIQPQEIVAPPQRIQPIALMPVMQVSQAIERREAIVSLVSGMMHDGEHYGTLPGTKQKMLFKPGAELLATFFGLEVSVTLNDQKEDWEKGIFAYTYKAVALHCGQRIAECEGACNTLEKKYRYLWIDAKPPASKDERARMKVYGEGRDSKYGTGWQIRIENPNPFDLVNTVKKMAQVRAYKGAVILATNSSAFFSYLTTPGSAPRSASTVHPNTQAVVDGDLFEEPETAESITSDDAQKLFWERVKQTRFDSREAAPIAKKAATGEITWAQAIAQLPPL